MKYFKYTAMTLVSLILTASPALASQVLTSIDVVRAIGFVYAAGSALIFVTNYIFVTKGLTKFGEKRRLLAILPPLFSLNLVWALVNIVLLWSGSALISTFFWVAFGLNSACFASVIILLIVHRKELFAKNGNDAE